MTEIKIKPPYIKLVQALKFCGAFETGGECSEAVKAGAAAVNGEVCVMRGKKLAGGDVFAVNGGEYIIKVD